MNNNKADIPQQAIGKLAQDKIAPTEKELKPLRGNKIGAKLLIILLISALIPIFFISILAITTMRNISGASQQANIQLGTHTSEDSETALMKQAETYLLKISQEQSLKTDAALFRVQSELVALSEYMSSLYLSFNNFAGRDLPLPNETENKVLSSKYMLAPTLQPTPALKREVKLISNAEYMIRPTQKENSMMSNVYLGTQTGITYRFSASNAYDVSYDARLRPWYAAAVAAGGNPVWMETETDQYGIICCTSAVAFYGENKELMGVIATDVTLDQMQKDITAIKIGETGYSFMMDEKGRMIAHPKLFENMSEPDYPNVGEMADKSGLLLSTIDDKQYYLAYHQLPTTSWYLAIVAEVDEIIDPALKTRLQINSYIKASQSGIQDGLRAVIFQFIIVIAATILVILVVSFFLSKTITTPVYSLLNAVEEISGGNLERLADVRGNDEISELGKAFNKMTTDLKNQMLEVKQVTAEKEKISAELSVAAKIQMSVVPSIFPAFPARNEFDIFAEMHPAKTVGGDFYDFFFLDSKHLCICIADVSGKGVPAALFMMRAKTLIQNKVLANSNLPQAVAEVNELLNESNEENMFVTAFVSVFNTATGELCYVNAGHNPPLLKHKGRYGWLEVKKSMVLGGFSNMKYELCHTMLFEGDSLLMYTDGVTEAMDINENLYGEERLLKTLNTAPGIPPKALVKTLKQDIDFFANGAQQADDIAILTVERKHL